MVITRNAMRLIMEWTVVASAGSLATRILSVVVKLDAVQMTNVVLVQHVLMINASHLVNAATSPIAT